MDIHDMTNKQKQIVLQSLRKRYSDKELKAYDDEVYNQQCTSNALNSANIEPSTDCLNGISQGTERENCIGGKYWMRKLDISGQLRYQPSSAVAVQPIARFIVYVDRRTNGNGTTGNSGGGLNGLYKPPTQSNLTVFAYELLSSSDRFDIICDKRFVMRPTSNVATTETADYTAIFNYHYNLEKYALECILPDGTNVPRNYTIRCGVLTNSNFIYLDYNYRIRFSG